MDDESTDSLSARSRKGPEWPLSHVWSPRVRDSDPRYRKGGSTGDAQRYPNVTAGDGPKGEAYWLGALRGGMTIVGALEGVFRAQ